MPVSITKRQWQPSSSTVIPRCSRTAQERGVDRMGWISQLSTHLCLKSSPAVGGRRSGNTNAVTHSSPKNRVKITMAKNTQLRNSNARRCCSGVRALVVQLPCNPISVYFTGNQD